MQFCFQHLDRVCLALGIALTGRRGFRDSSMISLLGDRARSIAAELGIPLAKECQ